MTHKSKNNKSNTSCHHSAGPQLAQLALLWPAKPYSRICCGRHFIRACHDAIVRSHRYEALWHSLRRESGQQARTRAIPRRALARLLRRGAVLRCARTCARAARGHARAACVRPGPRRGDLQSRDSTKMRSSVSLHATRLYPVALPSSESDTSHWYTEYAVHTA